MKVVIATGGTAGHIWPALQVAGELQKRSHEVVFQGSFNARVEEQIRLQGYVVENFKAQGLRCHWRSLFSHVRALYLAVRSLRIIKPQAVIGFGGYGAFGPVMAARLLGCPTMIHEQNVVPGKANKFLAKVVKRIAISFPQSNNFFPQHKTVLTGTPCRLSSHLSNNKIQSFKEFNLNEKNHTILVFGGSQGSHCVNETFIKAVVILNEKIPLQIIHICGDKDYGRVEIFYKQLRIPFALFRFLDKMKEAYEVADLVISRAGALTVTEIAMARIPAILIPYPYAGGHQKHNAEVLLKSGLALIIEETSLSPQKLANTILSILNQPLNTEEIEHQLKGVCFPDATVRIVREIESLIGGT